MAFETHRLFPDILIQMVSVGEKTGTVDEVLLRSCSFFDAQVETALRRPDYGAAAPHVIIMGVVVAVMFIAVYSPIPLHYDGAGRNGHGYSGRGFRRRLGVPVFGEVRRDYEFKLRNTAILCL